MRELWELSLKKKLIRAFVDVNSERSIRGSRNINGKIKGLWF